MWIFVRNGMQDYLMDFPWSGDNTFPPVGSSIDGDKPGGKKSTSDLLPFDGDHSISDDASNDDYDSSHDMELGPRSKKPKTEAERRKAR